MAEAQADFFRSMLPYARRVSELTGIDPRLVLAQSAIETGYGRSAPNSNFFGIKAPQGQGASLLTSEFENGQMVSRNEPFRTYASPAESFDDYANLMLSAARYQPVREAQTLEDQIAAMAASGYATDPNYGNLLTQVASRINLDDPGLIASDAMSGIGRGPDTSGMTATGRPRADTMNQPMQSQPEQERPRGLRGLLSNPDLFDRLAIGLGGMTLNPNTALMQMSADRIAGRREERTTRETGNRTAEWLRSQGRDDLAGAVLSGALGSRDAVTIAYQQPKAQGQILSADQMRQMFPGTQIEDGLYNLRPDGTANKVGGGGNVINMPAPEGAESKLFEALNRNLGEQFAGFLMSGTNSAVAMQDLDVLQELATLSPSGPLEGRFAEMFPEFNDVAAVRQSIITRVAPTLRVEGSGSTSDLEYNGMLRSLGSLRNNPEANQAIISLMQDKARFNVARANIVRELQAGRITVDAANQQIAELERSLAIPQQVQNVLRLGESGSLGDAAAEIESLIRQ